MVALFAALIALLDCATALRFRGDGTFSIVQFADLHFGEAENLGWGPLQDLGSLHVINAVLDNEKPDLAVFTGDQITGNNIKQNATAYWKMIVEPCEVRHTHFASIFGNHDTMPFETGYELSTTTRQELMQFDTSFRYSVSKPASNLTHAVSTYYLDVLSDKTDDIIARLWFFDTGGGSFPEHIYADQVDWFVRTSKELPKAAVSLAFLHIPLPEYSEAIQSGEKLWNE